MRYVPKSAVKIASKKSPAIAHLYLSGGKFYAVGYVGKAEKPSFHYSWRDQAKRNEWVAEWLRSCDARALEKAARKLSEQAQRDAGHKLSVGSVLRSSWGYDQTNIDYYQIVALRGKRQVVIREISGECVEVGYMQGKSIPLRDAFCGEEMVKSVSNRGDSVRIASYANAYLMEPIKSAGGLEVGYAASSWTAYA